MGENESPPLLCLLIAKLKQLTGRKLTPHSLKASKQERNFFILVFRQLCILQQFYRGELLLGQEMKKIYLEEKLLQVLLYMMNPVYEPKCVIHTQPTCILYFFWHCIFWQVCCLPLTQLHNISAYCTFWPNSGPIPHFCCSAVWIILSFHTKAPCKGQSIQHSILVLCNGLLQCQC